MALSDIIPYVGLQEVKNIKKLLKEVIAEFLGTMLLVILGCGACMQPANQQPAIQQPFKHTNNHTTIPYNHTTMQPANPKPKIPIPPVSTQSSVTDFHGTQLSKSRLVRKILVSFPITTVTFILIYSLLQLSLFCALNLVNFESCEIFNFTV